VRVMADLDEKSLFFLFLSCIGTQLYKYRWFARSNYSPFCKFNRTWCIYGLSGVCYLYKMTDDVKYAELATFYLSMYEFSILLSLFYLWKESKTRSVSSRHFFCRSIGSSYTKCKLTFYFYCSRLMSQH
jgi:hypothetical protein